RTIQKFRIPSLTLMENAGREVFSLLKKKFFTLSKKKILIVAGKGNNAGDGFVVARLLQKAGAKVSVWMLASPEELSGDARINYKKLVGQRVLSTGIPSSCILDGWSRGEAPSPPVSQKPFIIIDAIFGTGLSRKVRSPYKEAIRWINQQKSFVVSIDIPSGLSADTGKVLGEAVQADLTVTLGLPKRGLFLAPGTEVAGEVRVVDIGIPVGAALRGRPHKKGTHIGVPLQEHLITESDIAPLFKPRKKESHKGTYGHVLVIAGSERKLGAALMTAKAVLRSGSGLVTLALPDKAFKKIPKDFLEVMYEPLPSTVSGGFHFKGWKRLQVIAQDKDVIVVGPGMGTEKETKKFVQKILLLKKPLVIDADGLNFLSVSQLKGRKAPTILTPHPGEMSRLIKKTIKQIQGKRWEIVQKFSKNNHCFLLLKGYRTVLGTPEGKIFINTTGNPGMATAGMGDALTGMIASFIGQRFSTEEAICAAVFIHGRAGDQLAKKKGERGLTAGDLIEEIPYAIHF
ncbi:MAG: NAD(P)H-hydrate dehydratase, partial [bacterium]|nr:NAD(P)H-hydrate dehydratase [bacterium]